LLGHWNNDNTCGTGTVSLGTVINKMRFQRVCKR